MTRLQRYWVYFIVVFSLAHFVRDIFQDLGVHSVLSDSLVKSHERTPNWYWMVINTYVMEVLLFILALVSIRKKRFGVTGRLTVVIFTFFIAAFVFYWIFL